MALRGVTGLIGSEASNPALRDPNNADPIRDGLYRRTGAVDGKGGTNLSGPYEPVVGWPAPAHPGEWRTGSGRGVYAESPDRVVVVQAGEVPVHDHRGVWGASTFRDLRFNDVNDRFNADHRHCHEIVVHDREGTIIESWDRWLDALHENDVKAGRKPKAGHVNRIRVNRYDPDRHIWIVGGANTGVFKFTNDGSELVLKIDADAVPDALHPVYYAHDMAFLPDGDLLIAHMHHIMRFSADGTFITAFGGQGTGVLEFDGIHGIEVHPETLNVYINDRNNNRIQIVDPAGAYIDEWPGIEAAYAIRMTADSNYLWVSDGWTNKFMKYDMDGRLIRPATWGTFGIAPGAIWGPHWFETDDEGNLYVAEAYGGRVQKFQPMADVEPDDPQLIGPLSR